MNNLTGTWISPDFLNGKTDSGKFVKFLEDFTYIINDGMDQAESVYKVEGVDKLILEPALGLSATPLPFKYEIAKKGNNEILTLTIEKEGITYSLVKKKD